MNDRPTIVTPHRNWSAYVTDQDLRARVEAWLADMGTAPQERPDPNSHWHLAFEYPLGTRNFMLAASPLAGGPAVVVASVVRLAENHLKRFEDLADADKRAFLFGLRRALNRPDADFRLNDMDGPLVCPRSFQVSSRRFVDGLTLDTFARTVGGVFKTQLEGIWYIQEHLEERSADVAVFFDLADEDIPKA
jgi:hypothetical protein